MEEVWLPVFGLDCGIEVSNHGRIRSHREWTDGKSWRLIGQYPAKDGRMRTRFKLYPDEPRRNYLVHRLVALTFSCPVGEGRGHINHKDGDPANNRLDNLEWCTPAENNRHAIETGIVYHVGEAGPRALRRNKDAADIRALRAKGMKYKDILAAYPMAKSTLSYLINGRTWRDA